MAQIISYPTGTATSADFLLGIQTTTTGAQANPTKKFTMSDVVSAGSGATTVTIDISNAEWLALNGASKTLVAAPGAGKAIKVTELSVFFDFGTTNFTFAGNIGVSINSVNMGLVASVDSPLSADTVYSLPVDGGASNGVKLATNTALLLTAAGATGGDGVVKVKISYKILDTANF
jgi:hypothetical protein